MSVLVVAAWVYIGLFVFFAGFWSGAWLWWRECERIKEAVGREVIHVALRERSLPSKRAGRKR